MADIHLPKTKYNQLISKIKSPKVMWTKAVTQMCTCKSEFLQWGASEIRKFLCLIALLLFLFCASLVSSPSPKWAGIRWLGTLTPNSDTLFTQFSFTVKKNPKISYYTGSKTQKNCWPRFSYFDQLFSNFVGPFLTRYRERSAASLRDISVAFLAPEFELDG